MAQERFELLASAARTTSGTGAVTDLFRVHLYALFFLDVTAVSGTSPTLNVYVQSLMPDGVTYTDLGSFAQVTATSKRFILIPTVSTTVIESVLNDAALAAGSGVAIPIGPAVRVKWVISGTTPSFTFSVAANLYR